MRGKQVLREGQLLTGSVLGEPMRKETVRAHWPTPGAAGLASKKRNLKMLIERPARAEGWRVVPETIARFIREAADVAPLTRKLPRKWSRRRALDAMLPGVRR